MSKKIFYKYDFSEVLTIGLLISVIFLLLVNIINIENPIIERNGFRQTQTAITSYYYVKDGFRFDYLTPVLGFPWVAPFEFPIYQGIVALVVMASGAHLDIVGRIISLCFMLISLIYIYRILKFIGIDRDSVKVIMIIYVTMPTIMFWSGTFMIESTALAFTLACIWYFVNLAVVKDYIFYNAAAFTLCLTLALLQKVTTVLIPFSIIIGIYIFTLIKNKKDFISTVNILIFVGTAIAFFIFIYWLKYSDDIKKSGEISQFLTSNSLRAWNYGSFKDLLSKDYLSAIFLRAFSMNSGVFIGSLILIINFWNLKSNTYFKFLIISLILFFLPMIVFKPLHRVHDYYQYSNLIFLAVAVGLALSIPLIKNNKNYLIFTLCILITVNIICFFKFYGNQKFSSIQSTENKTLLIANYITSNTNAKDVVLIFGKDWSSEIPYYSQRRAIMVPDWYEKKANIPVGYLIATISESSSRYTESGFQMVVLCGEYKNFSNQVNFSSNTHWTSIEECLIGNIKSK